MQQRERLRSKHRIRKRLVRVESLESRIVLDGAAELGVIQNGDAAFISVPHGTGDYDVEDTLNRTAIEGIHRITIANNTVSSLAKDSISHTQTLDETAPSVPDTSFEESRGTAYFDLLGDWYALTVRDSVNDSAAIELPDAPPNFLPPDIDQMASAPRDKSPLTQPGKAATIAQAKEGPAVTDNNLSEEDPASKIERNETNQNSEPDRVARKSLSQDRYFVRSPTTGIGRTQLAWSTASSVSATRHHIVQDFQGPTRVRYAPVTTASSTSPGFAVESLSVNDLLARSLTTRTETVRHEAAESAIPLSQGNFQHSADQVPIQVTAVERTASVDQSPQNVRDYLFSHFDAISLLLGISFVTAHVIADAQSDTNAKPRIASLRPACRR